MQKTSLTTRVEKTISPQFDVRELKARAIGRWPWEREKTLSEREIAAIIALHCSYPLQEGENPADQVISYLQKVVDRPLIYRDDHVLYIRAAAEGQYRLSVEKNQKNRKI